jgi:hypothetical protein
MVKEEVEREEERLREQGVRFHRVRRWLSLALDERHGDALTSLPSAVRAREWLIGKGKVSSKG